MLHLHTAEAAPLAPLLVPLSELVLLVVALGIIVMVRKFLEALLGGLGSFVSSIPLIGSSTSSVIHKAEQRVSNALGQAASSVDQRIGVAWHQLARIADWLGREIRSHANLIYMLSTLLLGAATTGLLRGTVALFHLRLRAATHAANLAISRAVALEHRLAHTIATGVYPRLRTVEHEIAKTIPREITNLRKWARSVEQEAVRAFRLARANERALIGAAFAGAVAVALARLGASWVRCGTANRFFQKRGCNAWNDLDSLLGLVVAAVAVEDLRELVKVLQAVEAEAVKGIEVVLHA